MSITPISPPDVQVEQILKRVVPANNGTLLPACVIGRCTQTVPAQVTTATGGRQINANAQAASPAIAQTKDASGSPPAYTLSAKDCLVFSVTNKFKVVSVFEAGDYTPAQAGDVVAKALLANEEGDAVVKVVKDLAGNVGGIAFRIVTLGKTEDDSIDIDPEGRRAAVLLGNVDLTGLSYPGDVTGKTLIIAVDDGDAQTVTIASPADAPALISALSSGIVGGTAALDASDFLQITSDRVGETSKLEILGGTLLTTVGLTNGDVDSGRGSTSGVLTAFGFDTTDIFFGASQYRNFELTLPPSAYPDPNGNIDQVVLETDTARAFLSTSGGASLSEVLRKTALLRKNTAAVTVVDDGNGDNKSPIVNIAGENFRNPTPTAAVVTAAGIPNFASLSNKAVLLSDGRAPRTVNFGVVTTIAEVVDAINAVFNIGDGLQASVSSLKLRLTSTRLREDGSTAATGEDSQIIVVGGNGAPYLDSDATPVLKVGRYVGNPHKVAVGDELYVDGVLKGKVIQVAPSGQNTRLKLDKQLPLSFTGSTFHIVANNLASINAGGDTDRPAPNLIVSDDGALTLKQGILRTTRGLVTESVVSNVLYPGRASLYVQYRALRLDVSPQNGTGLLSMPSLDTIEQVLSPIDSTNPLGLATYLAKLNAPLLDVQALGISATSDDQPDGTTSAHEEAAAYLEAFDVYALAILSQDDEVNSIWASHVTTMSAKTRKRERIVFLSTVEPTRALDTLVASGGTGNTVGNGGLTFDTGLTELEQLLLEAGLDPSTTLAATDGVYLDVESDGKRYSVEEINGTLLTLRTTFSPGENTDGYYSTTGISGTLIDVSFGVRIRGALLTLPNGQPDKNKIANTYGEKGQRFANRRVYLTMPDTVSMVIEGVEQNVPGYFLNAAMVGIIASAPPQQTMTAAPVVGVSRVERSFPYFNDSQLDIIAGGGVWIYHQENPQAPVTVRHALSTDRTSVVTQSDNITRQLDFAAKAQRIALKGPMSRLNIDENSADTANTVLQSVIEFLVGKGFIKNIKVNGIEVLGEDKYQIDESAEVFAPINGIVIRMFV